MTQNALLPSTDPLSHVDTEGSVDPHFHFRNPEEDNDGRLEMLMDHVVNEHEDVIAIGNTSPPILTLADAIAYKQKIVDRIPAGKSLNVYVAPLLTDTTTPEMVREMRADPTRAVVCLKAYFEGVSNDGGASISNVAALAETIKATYDDSVDAPPLPIDFHAERKYDAHGKRIPMQDREWYCVDQDMRSLIWAHPKGNFAIKHISDLRTVGFIENIRRQGYKVFGEICPSYLMDSHEDLYEGPGNVGTAFRANKLRWPIPKGDPSRERLRNVVLSGDPGFFYGSDCACHFEDPTKEGGVKITCTGFVCGGATILPAVDKSIVIDFLVENGKPELIDEFMSRRARARLRLPPATRKVRYERTDWTVPSFIEGHKKGEPTKARLYMWGETCNWRRAA